MAFGRKQVVKTLENAMENPGKSFKAKNGEIIRQGQILSVFHFGTKILTVDLDSQEVTLGQGYSNTDQTIINTVLSRLGISRRVTRKGGTISLV